MGNKPTLVFIHGYAVGGWYFDDFKAFFESLGYNCHAPTLPFHDVHPAIRNADISELGINDYVDFLEKEILALNTTPVLVGHSLGGLLAQHLANRGLADDLILLQPAAPADISMITPSQAIYHASPIVKAFRNQPFKYPYKAARHLFFNAMSEQAALDLYHRTVYESPKVMREILTHQQAPIDPDNINGRLLVIAGSRDRGCTPAIVRKIADKYGEKSSYKEFAGRGHEIVIEEGWQDVANHMHQWLQHNRSTSTLSATAA